MKFLNIFLTKGALVFLLLILTIWISTGCASRYNSKKNWHRYTPSTKRGGGCGCLNFDSEVFPFAKFHVITNSAEA